MEDASGRIGGRRIVLIGQEKGDDTTSRLKHNFGMARPEGYRKALRAMQLAAKFNRPIMVFIDTPGAYPGVDAEERGQAEAIAHNLRDMSRLPVPIIVTNTGTAIADGVELSSTAPSGWKIEFTPKTIDRIDPGKDTEVQAQITPTATSLAGDYQATIRATSRGEAANTQFRVAVTTSNSWYMAGAGIIGVAILFMVAAVARFGRR